MASLLSRWQGSRSPKLLWPPKPWLVRMALVYKPFVCQNIKWSCQLNCALSAEFCTKLTAKVSYIAIRLVTNGNKQRSELIKLSTQIRGAVKLGLSLEGREHDLRVPQKKISGRRRQEIRWRWGISENMVHLIIVTNHRTFTSLN
jgi:hypothetical protein